MKLWCTVMWIAVSISLATPVTTAAQYFPADEDLRLVLRYMVEDEVAPGIVVGLVEEDGSTRTISYGTGGGDARPLGPRSVFDLGSINKTFTATLLADMVLRGEVDLQDPIVRYLPSSVVVPSYGGREITLLDLATHTSGLPRLPNNYRPPDMRDPYAAYTVDILYEFLSGHELRRAPGTEYEYSNLGFGLLGHVLARAASTSYRNLLHERVLAPLGMEQTGYETDDQVAEWMVWGHKYGNAVQYWGGTEAIDGAGGLRSSVSDMLAYLRANIGPPQTHLESAMRMAQEPRGAVREGGPEYGLSWAIRSARGRPTMKTHGGGTGGFTTSIAFTPEMRMGIVTLANSSGAAVGLEALLVFDPPPDEWEDRTVAPEVLARYVGKYSSSDPESDYYVRLEDEGFLTYQPRGRSRARLYAKSDTSFYLLQGPWSVAFRTGASGDTQEALIEIDERDPSQETRLVAVRTGLRTPSPAVVAGNAGLVVTLAAFAEPVAWTVYGWGPVGWVLLSSVLLATAVGLIWSLLRRRRARRVQAA